MGKQRKTHSGKFKAKVALEAIKSDQSINQIAQKHELHPQQITQWKKQLLDGAELLMTDKRASKQKDEDALVNQLYQQIGQLKVELDWLKKKAGFLH